MILVVGPIASGKREFAESLGYSEADCSRDASDSRPVLVDAQDLVRDEGVDIVGLAKRIAASKGLVAFVEVGAGIVPLDAGERYWRERAGAFSRELATRAEAVIRMTCGIPQVLKGDAGQVKVSDHPVACSAESVEVDANASEETSVAEGRSESRTASACDSSGGFEPHSFFSNRRCKYFPCHDGVAEDEFNCLFCYCPLYALGPRCGGNYTYTKKGRKNCVNCSIPHRRDFGVELVSDHYELLADLAARKVEGREESVS